MNDRRFSVLLVSHTYPPVLGGSEVEAQRVCSALLRRGHRVTVLCSGGPPMADVSTRIDPAGVPVRIFGRHRVLAGHSIDKVMDRCEALYSETLDEVRR